MDSIPAELLSEMLKQAKEIVGYDKPVKLTVVSNILDPDIYVAKNGSIVMSVAEFLNGEADFYNKIQLQIMRSALIHEMCHLKHENEYRQHLHNVFRIMITGASVISFKLLFTYARYSTEYIIEEKTLSYDREGTKLRLIRGLDSRSEDSLKRFFNRILVVAILDLSEEDGNIRKIANDWKNGLVSEEHLELVHDRFKTVPDKISADLPPFEKTLDEILAIYV